MARPLRLEYAGALYHVTSRGDRREEIYRDAYDREGWLELLGSVCSRFNWVVHGYCQMTNHYHLLVETVEGNLSRGMRQLNGEFTQQFNRRHGVVGHLYQGRYEAIVVQKEAYLLELTRYVVLNPVRAGMVEDAESWPWSSYRAMAGLANAPPWLDTDWLLGQFARQRTRAIRACRDFVAAGFGVAGPLDQTRHQLLLGDDTFVGRHKRVDEELPERSMAHKRSLACSLQQFRQRFENRDEAMARAYLSGAYTMAQIGEFFSVHYMTVSRAVKKFERDHK